MNRKQNSRLAARLFAAGKLKSDKHPADVIKDELARRRITLRLMELISFSPAAYHAAKRSWE